MKKDNQLFKNIIILIVVTLLVIPFMFTMFGLDKQVYESFSTYDKSAEDVCMNVFSYGAGANPEYGYCINGDISCGSDGRQLCFCQTIIKEEGKSWFF